MPDQLDGQFANLGPSNWEHPLQKFQDPPTYPHSVASGAPTAASFGTVSPTHAPTFEPTVVSTATPTPDPTSGASEQTCSEDTFPYAKAAAGLAAADVALGYVIYRMAQKPIA